MSGFGYLTGREPVSSLGRDRAGGSEPSSKPQADQLTQHGANSPSAAAGHSQDSPQASVPCSFSFPGVPAAPSLSLHPQKQEYLPGDTVEIKCSAPPSVDSVGGFQYLSDIGKAITVLASSRTSHIFKMSLTGPEDGGSYHCTYWIGQGHSWNRSSDSDAVLIRVKVRRHFWVRELAVGGSFFTINGLIFLISHLCMKGKGSKEKHTGVSDPFQSDYYSVPVRSVIRQSGHSVTAKANHIPSPMSRGNNEYQEEV
ncbi:uncharacterized protein LOC141997541 isoform X2 [Natator depressus]|uniref:uncharacterized protein LOC141997541 isoform X2 n=1 Tax=Natator depressus TaxID=27790 RepID=UPI003EC0533C